MWIGRTSGVDRDSCREVSLPVGEPITSSNEPDIRNDETYQGFTAENSPIELPLYVDVNKEPSINS